MSSLRSAGIFSAAAVAAGLSSAQAEPRALTSFGDGLERNCPVVEVTGYFCTDKDTCGDKEPALREVLREAIEKADTDKDGEVDGYAMANTSEVASDEYNQRLSERRLAYGIKLATEEGITIVASRAFGETFAQGDSPDANVDEDRNFTLLITDDGRDKVITKLPDGRFAVVPGVATVSYDGPACNQ